MFKTFDLSIAIQNTESGPEERGKVGYDRIWIFRRETEGEIHLRGSR